MKARLQRCLSRCPLGSQVNYLMQRYIVRSLPIDDAGIREMARIANAHLEAFANYCRQPPQHPQLLEVGAGTDLTVPLVLYAQGIERQFTIDIRALAKRFLVNSALGALRSIDLPLHRRPAAVIAPRQELRAALRERYGIRYLAPCDARRTGLAPGSIDLIHSTNTLEHVPAHDLTPILNECRRLLSPRGVLSFYIDYRDHYSYCDSGITAYNFLRYSDAAWARFNCDLQYQNRLRHSDYLELAQKSGFRIAAQHPIEPSEADLRLVETMGIDRRFGRYDLGDLAVQGAHLVLSAG